MFDCSGTSGDFSFLFHFSEILLDLFFKRLEILLNYIPNFFWIHLEITVNQKMSHCYDDFPVCFRVGSKRPLSLTCSLIHQNLVIVSCTFCERQLIISTFKMI